MAKFIRKVSPVLSLGGVLEKAARDVDAAVDLQETLAAAIEAEVVNGHTAEIETGVSFDVDAIVDCCDDGVEYRDVGAQIAEALGVKLSVDPVAVLTLLEKLVGQVRDRVRKDLEALDFKTKNGNIVIEADAVTVLDILGSVVDTCVGDAKMRLRNTERDAIAKHNDEVRAANARVLAMPKPTPAPAAPAPAEAAPAPAEAAPAPAEAAPAPAKAAPEPAPAAPAAKKPRAPRKPKAAPADAPVAAPATGKHPVDVAEALLVLDDPNATEDAVAAALALLA